MGRPSGNEIIPLLLNLKVPYLSSQEFASGLYPESVYSPNPNILYIEDSFHYSSIYASVTQLIFHHILRMDSRP
jgi:hypothetical protein